MQELTHNKWTNHEKITNHLRNKKMGVWHAWARQNDNTRELQVGCAASRHHSVSEVYSDISFKGVHVDNQTQANNNLVIAPHDHA